MQELLSNYGWGLPVQASTFAAKIDHSLLIVHAAMVTIFVLWAIYFAYCLLRYRQGRQNSAEYGKKESLAAYTPDLVIFVFEIWLIFVIGVPIWAHIREELPKPAEATVIRLQAQQFAWIAHYPGPDGIFGKQDVKFVNTDNPVGLDSSDPAAKDDFISVDKIYAPANKPVLIQMTSQDVIHSFFVPEFRIKQDVVPGLEMPIWVEPSRIGHYEIGCAQLCGTGHFKMRGDFYVTSIDDFNAWAAQQAPLIRG